MVAKIKHWVFMKYLRFELWKLERRIRRVK